jgi:hypothetical protein
VILLSEVEYNLENWEKCTCNTCPVQEKSKCVKDKRAQVIKLMPKINETKIMPNPDMIPDLYCATGRAPCEDIDTTEMCQCNKCPLWKEYDLPYGEPMGYFCRDGAAE